MVVDDDGVFLDAQLPDGDGMDLIERFAKPSTVVLLSGGEDTTVKNEAICKGGKLYLGKRDLNLQNLKQAMALL